MSIDVDTKSTAEEVVKRGGFSRGGEKAIVLAG
jgi:hypothetical protein